MQIRYFISILTLFLLLSCGNKGPLYMPDAEPTMQPEAELTPQQDTNSLEN